MAKDELPLPQYDELPLGSIQHRIRSLDANGLRELMAYESEHAARTAVLEVMRNRLDELDAGAEPSGGDQERIPEVTGEAGGSPVQPATGAEPSTPLRHGVAQQTPSRGRP